MPPENRGQTGIVPQITCWQDVRNSRTGGILFAVLCLQHIPSGYVSSVNTQLGRQQNRSVYCRPCTGSTSRRVTQKPQLLQQSNAANNLDKACVFNPMVEKTRLQPTGTRCLRDSSPYDQFPVRNSSSRASRINQESRCPLRVELLPLNSWSSHKYHYIPAVSGYYELSRGSVATVLVSGRKTIVESG